MALTWRTPRPWRGQEASVSDKDRDLSALSAWCGPSYLTRPLFRAAPTSEIRVGPLCPALRRWSRGPPSLTSSSASCKLQHSQKGAGSWLKTRKTTHTHKMLVRIQHLLHANSPIASLISTGSTLSSATSLNRGEGEAQSGSAGCPQGDLREGTQLGGYRARV